MNIDITSLGNADEILEKLPALPYGDKTQLPSRQGIYFLIHIKKEILYIGKTKNFNTRWISHHKIAEITNKYELDDLLIAYCEVSDDEIDKSEALLIRKFKPELNILLVPENTTPTFTFLRSSTFSLAILKSIFLCLNEILL